MSFLSQIENGERTTNTHRNINGNSGSKTGDQKENTKNDDKENECPAQPQFPCSGPQNR